MTEPALTTDPAPEPTRAKASPPSQPARDRTPPAPADDQSARSDDRSAHADDPAARSDDRSAHADDPAARADTLRGIGVLATLAVIFLVVMLRLAHAAIVDSYDLNSALSAAALVLPLVITVSLVTGAAVGLFAAQTLRTRLRGAGTRIGVAALAGLLIGAASTAAILSTFGGNSAVATLAIAVGAAGAIGGAIGGLPVQAAVRSGVAGSLTVFVLGGAFGLLHGPLMNLFGAGGTAASRLSASGWLGLSTAVFDGLVAGALGYWLLRGTDRGRPVAASHAMVYLLAGGMPGLLLLLGDLITRLGGAHLLALVAQLSDYDRTGQQWISSTRLVTALIIFFVGGIGAMVAFGRTLPDRNRTLPDRNQPSS
jgi:hypothetical protein